MIPWRSFAGILVLSVLMVSCRSTKQMIYFSNDAKQDSTVALQDIVPHGNATIQTGDILAISIASISFAPDDRPSQVFLEGGLTFNTPISGAGNMGAASAGTAAKNSYLVDSAGFIDYPRIGKLKMAGLSMPEAKEEMARRLKDYLKQPVVEVRIVNYKITMLGEVGTPGPILASNHKMTIIDALAAAGGIPITGRMDNVLVIRDNNGKREFAHLDLHSKNVFNSPYFYLRQNDIVYVEPTRLRRQEANAFLRFYLPTVMTLISSVVTVIALTKLN